VLVPAFLPSPTVNGFHVGPIFVHAYGLAYVVAVAAAIALTTRRWERRGGARTLVHEVALWGFPAGLVGGRLYHLATSWNEVPHQWWGPLAIWQGGLGIWGGIAGGTLAGVWVLRRRHVDTAAFMDAAAPGLLVAQAIGRIGNYFNQELFGGPTTLPWGLEIDPAHRPVGYERFATFHPTFLYELLWNLALASVLIWLGRRQRIRAPGLFALYVAGYSLGRIGEELLRVDPAHHLFGLRLNLYVASVLCVAGLGWFARIQRLNVQPKAAVNAEPHGPRSARGSESRRQRSARKADVRPLRCSAACLWRDLNDGSPSSWRWCPGRSPGMSMSHPPTCAARGRLQAQQRERQQRSRPLRVLGRPGRHLGHRPSAEAHAPGRWAVATWYCDEAVAGSVASDYWKWLETALLVGVRPAEVG